MLCSAELRSVQNMGTVAVLGQRCIQPSAWSLAGAHSTGLRKEDETPASS